MTDVEVGLAATIRDQLGNFSPAERKVGRVLLAAYPSAGLQSVAWLAQRAAVSAPTVIRFVRRLGFDGFPDFQAALRAEIDERQAFPLTRVAEIRREPSSEGGGGGGLVEFGVVVSDAIHRTLESLPAAEVDATVALLADPACRLTVTGGRFSRLVAHYLALHLMQLRNGVRLLPLAPVERAAALHDLGRRDVLVLFDFRRYEPFHERLAAEAAANGAKIVLFTDRWLSPAASHADVVLPAAVDAVSAYDSFVPTLSLVEGLIARMVADDPGAAERRLAEFERTSSELHLL